MFHLSNGLIPYLREVSFQQVMMLNTCHWLAQYYCVTSLRQCRFWHTIKLRELLPITDQQDGILARGAPRTQTQLSSTVIVRPSWRTNKAQFDLLNPIMRHLEVISYLSCLIPNATVYLLFGAYPRQYVAAQMSLRNWCLSSRICDVFLTSLSWLSSASFPGYHSLHYCLL